MKKSFKIIISSTIVAIVLCAITIPVFAFGIEVLSSPDYTYTKSWFLSGSSSDGSNYKEIRQSNSSTQMNLGSNRAKFDASIAFKTFQAIPANVPVPSAISVSYKVLKQLSAFYWAPITFYDNSGNVAFDTKIINNNCSPSRSVSTTTYVATPIYSESLLPNGNYQMDMFVSSNSNIPSLADYVRLTFNCDVYKMTSQSSANTSYPTADQISLYFSYCSPVWRAI